MNEHFISKATLGRLPQYLEFLKTLPHTRTTISATEIAKALSLGDQGTQCVKAQSWQDTRVGRTAFRCPIRLLPTHS